MTGKAGRRHLVASLRRFRTISRDVSDLSAVVALPVAAAAAAAE